MVDGGKARVILDVLVTPAEVTENLPMLELFFRSRFRWRLHPRLVSGDAAYGTTENIAAIEKAGIRAYIALVDHEKRTFLFGKDAFSLTKPKKTSTLAPEASSCVVEATITGRGLSGTQRSLPPATRVRSKPGVPRARRGAG